MSEKTAFAKEEIGLFWRIPIHLWGPISLLATFALAASKVPLDLLAVGLMGFYLSAFLQMRGFVYSLVLLGIAIPIRHFLSDGHHLWLLGIEGSMACAFFITALGYEHSEAKTKSLGDLIDTGKASLANSEEERAKEREAAVAAQLAFQEKIASLQKEYDDLQSEHSSHLILNEVLRKTAAKKGEENQKIAEFASDLQRRISVLQNELHESQKELSRVKASDALVLENQKIMKELNAARYEKEQTHLINETLARLHARESMNVKEASQKIEVLAAEKRSMESRLQAELAAMKTESRIYSDNHEQTSLELEKMRRTLHDMKAVNEQKNFLQERLGRAEEEIALWKQKAGQNQIDLKSQEKIEALTQERQQLAEQLSHALDKIRALSQTESLFKQLKKQFDEKNEILHQTRSELFKTDTELQRLAMEKEQAALHFNPISKEVSEQLESLDEQLRQLDEENKQLQEIITSLSGSEPDSSSQKRKKKVKTNPQTDQQDSLF